MSLPSRSARQSAPPRPDPEALLLAAIRDRDSGATSRLLGQWVHRRGMTSLRTFQRLTLPGVEGEEACRWLELQLGATPTGSAGMAAPLPPTAAATPAATSPTLEEENLPTHPAGSTPAAPVPQVPEAAEAPAQEGGQPEASVAEPLELPLPAHLASLAAIDPWAEPDAVPPPPATVPPEPVVQPGEPAGPVPTVFNFGPSTQPGSMTGAAIGSDPPSVSPAADAPAPEIGWKQRFGFARDGLARGRRSLGNAGSLLRDLFEEALDSLQPAAPEEEFRSDALQVDPSPGEPHRSSTPPATAQAPTADAPIPADSGPDADPAGTLPTENVAPQPLFTRGADPRPAPPTNPFRLPSPQAGPTDLRPAPPPDALADLRAWLPDAGDLPRVS